MKSIAIFVLAFIIMAISGCGYNVMQQNEEAVKSAWGNVEAAYQRRNDLIPNFVETVKAYAKHERQTLQAVIDARSRVGNITVSKDMIGDTQSMARFQDAQATMSGALSRLLVVLERYPDLKANENFRDLQNQLEETENRISNARTRYNKAVKDFNISIRIFPNNLTNKALLHLAEKQPFKADKGAERAPVVKFE